MEKDSHRPTITEVLEEQEEKLQTIKRREFLLRVAGGLGIVAADTLLNPYSALHSLAERVSAPKNYEKEGYDLAMSGITSGIQEFDIRGGLFILHDTTRRFYPDRQAPIIPIDNVEKVQNPISYQRKIAQAGTIDLHAEEWLVYFSTIYKAPLCFQYDASTTSILNGDGQELDKVPAHRVLANYYDNGQDGSGRVITAPHLGAQEKMTFRVYSVGESSPITGKKA